MTWQVGQKVIVARPNNQGVELVERTISKIGRKWITAKGDWAEDRFDHEGYSERRVGWRARLWPDRATYEAHVHIRQRWAAFHSLVRERNHPPAHLSVEQIENLIATVTGALSPALAE